MADFFKTPLELFSGLTILFVAARGAVGVPLGPEVEAGAGRCPAPARTHLALRRIWL
jgi:hypothetical protein